MDAAAAKALFTHDLLDICQADWRGRLSVRPMKRGLSNNQNTTCQNLLAMPTRQVIEKMTLLAGSKHLSTAEKQKVS